MTPLILAAMLAPFLATWYAMYQLDYVEEDDEPEDQGVPLNPDGTLPEDL